MDENSRGGKPTLIIHEAEEGGYWAEVPSLPGCATQGETLDELLRNVREAAEGTLSTEVRMKPQTGGLGDYTAEREALFGHLTLEDILAEIRAFKAATAKDDDSDTREPGSDPPRDPS